MIKSIIGLYHQRSQFFIELLLQHLYITSVCIVITTTVGLLLGLLMTRHPLIAAIVLRLSSVIYTIPSIAIFGILVSITGIGLASAIIAIVLYGLLPMVRSTYTGLTEVDDEIIEAAVGMGSGQRHLLFWVRLPLALAVIFSGFRTMVVMTIALGGIASFIGAGGLGRAIWRGISTNYAEMTIAGSLLIAAIAIVADLILEYIEKRVRIRYLGEEG